MTIMAFMISKRGSPVTLSQASSFMTREASRVAPQKKSNCLNVSSRSERQRQTRRRGLMPYGECDTTA